MGILEMLKWKYMDKKVHHWTCVFFLKNIQGVGSGLSGRLGAHFHQAHGLPNRPHGWREEWSVLRRHNRQRLPGQLSWVWGPRCMHSFIISFITICKLELRSILTKPKRENISWWICEVCDLSPLQDNSTWLESTLDTDTAWRLPRDMLAAVRFKPSSTNPPNMDLTCHNQNQPSIKEHSTTFICNIVASGTTQIFSNKWGSFWRQVSFNLVGTSCSSNKLPWTWSKNKQTAPKTTAKLIENFEDVSNSNCSHGNFGPCQKWSKTLQFHFAHHQTPTGRKQIHQRPRVLPIPEHGASDGPVPWCWIPKNPLEESKSGVTGFEGLYFWDTLYYSINLVKTCKKM